MRFHKERGGAVPMIHEDLLSSLDYDTDSEMPLIDPISQWPLGAVPYSKRNMAQCADWVCFYENDSSSEEAWRDPLGVAERLKAYPGVIAPDFSVYGDMPKHVQMWQIFRSCALAALWQQCDIAVIPNIRCARSDLLPIACGGIETGSTVAIGTYGFTRDLEERRIIEETIDYIGSEISPQRLVIYGSDNYESLKSIREAGTDVIQLQPYIRRVHETGMCSGSSKTLVSGAGQLELSL